MTPSTSTTKAYESVQPHLPKASHSTSSLATSSPVKSSALKPLAAKSRTSKLSVASHVGHAVDHIFVLWGEHFFESAAVIFATILREAGLCVKLVGVNGMQAAGRNRVLLQADLSVTTALELATRVCAIVVPCTPAALRRLGNDPRIHQLFQQATRNDACFFIPPEMSTTANCLKFLGISAKSVLPYSTEPALISFVQQLAPQVATILNTGDSLPAALANFTFVQST
jgi:hypothetical protein